MAENFLDGADRNEVAFRIDTREGGMHRAATNLGRPNLNPPDVVIEDNVQLFAFTLNTDIVFGFWDVTQNYAGGDLIIKVEWTNDGSINEVGDAVKVQIDYQVLTVGQVLSGSHANSPKTTEDTYPNNLGWVFNITESMTIAAADFVGAHGVYFKLSFVTPGGGAISGDPHLVGLEVEFSEFPNE